MKKLDWVPHFTLKLTEEEKQELEIAIVMGELARKTNFPLGGGSG